MDPTVLRSALEKKWHEGSLPVINGALSRSQLTLDLNLPKGALHAGYLSKRWGFALVVLEKFELEWIDSESDRLRNKLLKLHLANQLPISKGYLGRYNCEHQLELPIGALNRWPWAKKVADEFDQYLSDIGWGIKWVRKVPEIRQWLENQKLEELPTNSFGRLSRSKVMNNFGMQNTRVSTEIARSPELGKLMDEFDKKLEPFKEQNRFKYSERAAELALLLAKPDLTLSQGRIISNTKLAAILNAPVSALKNTPRLKALLDAKQKELDASFRRGTTTISFRVDGVSRINLGYKPYSEKHQRVFDFSGLSDAFGMMFSEYIGTMFHAAAEEYACASGPYNQLIRIFNWISQNASSYSKILDSFKCATLPDSYAYERMIQEYQASKLSFARDKGYSIDRAKRESSVCVMHILADLGVFPSLSHLPKSRSRRPSDTRHRPTLLEAKLSKDELGYAVALMSDAAKYRSMSMTNSEVIAFVSTLINERAQRPGLPVPLSEAMLLISSERLHEVRKCASIFFKTEQAKLEQGDRWISQSKYSAEEIWTLIGHSSRTKERRREITKLFPIDDQEIVKTNLATLIAGKFHRICPTASSHEGIFARQYLKIGGVAQLQNALLPSRIMVSSALLLYLAESGANLSVALSLPKSPLKASPTPGHCRIVGSKARSGDAPIVDDLPYRSADEIVSAAEALSFLAKKAPLFSAEFSGDEDLLARFAYGGIIRNLPENGIRADMRTICARNDQLRKLILVPSMLRPTKLLEVQLRNPSDIGIVQSIANHDSSKTTFGYVGKLPFRMILEAKMREFVDTVQVVISSNAEFAKNKLALNEYAWNAALERAQRSGLGTFCRDPLAGPQSDYQGIKCIAVDRCVGCANNIVVADSKSIVEMLLWREALQSAEAEWVAHRSARWEGTWLPWLAFFNVVLDEKLTRGEFAFIKKQAIVAVTELKNNPGFRPKDIW